MHRSDFENSFVGRKPTPLSPNPILLLAKPVQQAAVAVILRFDLEDSNPEVLLMTRAENPRDRWSGQVCLPGGKRDLQDLDLFNCAIRETREELSVVLKTQAQYLGPMDSLWATSKGQGLAMSISPFVFIQTADFQVEHNAEAVHHFWLPLLPARQGMFDSKHDFVSTNGTKMILPAWSYENEVIWGLTYQMLQSLLQSVW